MATNVEVTVTDRALIEALNTPGGAIFEWRDDVGVDTVRIATGLSPVNDVLNTLGPGHAPPGAYKAGWGWDRVGSQGHTVRATIYNSSDHADLVEYGRSPTTGWERFSWRGFVPPGDVRAQRGTMGYRGKHILAKAASAAVGAAVGGGGFSLFTPE